MKLRKKRKKEQNNKKNLTKATIILTMLICIIIAMITYWVYAYNHKYSKYDFDDTKLVSHKIKDYVEVKGDLVHLKNISNTIIEDFENKQNNILKNNITNIEIKKGLYSNILSIVIRYTILNNKNNYEEVLTINIDLQNDRILDDEDLINMSNSNYKIIATNIFNNNIKLPSDSQKNVIDSITEKELTAKEFNDNSEKYIIRIREKLPDIMNLYIEENKLYGIVKLSEIEKVCYYTNSNDKLVNIKIEIGKI